MCFQLKELILSLHWGKENGCEDGRNGNTDVIAIVEEQDDDGQPRFVKYLASFFAYDNIAELTIRHEADGNFLNGTYFHSRNMVLINRCTQDNIEKVVEHLMEQGEFGEVFRRIS